jgi:hypothetical protein
MRRLTRTSRALSSVEGSYFAEKLLGSNLQNSIDSIKRSEGERDWLLFWDEGACSEGGHQGDRRKVEKTDKIKKGISLLGKK